MDGFKKNKKNKLLVFCLSVSMLTAVAGFTTACGTAKKEKPSDSEVSLTEKDTGHIKNAKFELDKLSEKNAIISPTSWTKSVDSSTTGTSVPQSGVVSVEKWSEYFVDTSSLPHLTQADAKKNWKNLTLRDKLEFIQTWTDEDDEHKVKDLSFYDENDPAFQTSLKFSDLPTCANPSTHDSVSGEEKGNVLMLHNGYKDEFGMAQKYTSSTSVNVAAGTTVKFSVWVKTQNLTTSKTAVPGEEGSGNQQESVSDRGAYIGVAHTVGGTTLDQLQIKNINTAGVSENNGWKQYTVYLKGATYSDSTFTLSLGLGTTATGKFEYVSGYAFFDDIECTVMTNEAYDANHKTTAEQGDNVVTASSLAKEKLFLTDGAFKDTDTFVLDLSTDFTSANLTSASFACGQTADVDDGLGGTVHDAADLIETSVNDVTGMYLLSDLQEMTENTRLIYALGQDFADYPFADENVLMLFSESGSPFTAETTNFTLEANSYYALSFYVKTSVVEGDVGAGVSIVYEDEKTSLLSSMTTKDTAKVDVDEGDDIFKGWQRAYIFLENASDEDVNYSLAFTYGPTEIASSSVKDFRAGYVAFASFEEATLTKDEFKRATSSAFSAVKTLGEDEEKSLLKFDDPTLVPSDAIESGYAIPQNYTGVYSDSGYVSFNGTNNEKNAYPYAGLLNADYVDAYKTNEATLFPSAMFDITELLDENTQPLFIYNYNETENATAYGYIGSTQTIASNTYTAISVKVKASAGAVANLYMIDTSESSYTDALSVSTLDYIYWYDEDGNVCVSDPTKASFNKKTGIAFYLNDQGLYEANKKWSEYETYKDKLFFNLKNYDKDEDGNLLVKKGGVEYNYDDSKRVGDGNDGIAFYAKKDAQETVHYYAYSSCKEKDEVFDLSTVPDLARYKDASETKSLSFTVYGTDEWETYTFYIHTGSESKSYRLEAWSGSRDGAVKNGDGTYVMFSLPYSTTDETSFKNLIGYVKDELGCTTDEEFKGQSNVVYSVYSFYDDPAFLRYDKTIDKDKTGNLYESYDSTAYTEGVVYLEYNNYEGRVFKLVDYANVDVSVSPDVEEEDTTDDDEKTEKPKTEMNVWLLASSLALAVVLLITIVSIVLQRVLKKKHIHLFKRKKKDKK